MIFVSHHEETFNHRHGRFIRARGDQLMRYRHTQKGTEGRTDREVQIVIALQMAGSVWKSKHFKMKSSND